MTDKPLSSTESLPAQLARILLRDGLTEMRNTLSRGIEPEPWPPHFSHVIALVEQLAQTAAMTFPPLMAMAEVMDRASFRISPPPSLPMSLPLDSGPINGSRAPFQRERRYIVIKRKHLTDGQERRIREFLDARGIHTISAVVVEEDWPEYEPVWQMIEERCSR